MAGPVAPEPPPMPEWAAPRGPWCLRQWITRHTDPGPQVVVVCLRDPGHAGYCRDQHERYRSDELGDISCGWLKVREA